MRRDLAGRIARQFPRLGTRWCCDSVIAEIRRGQPLKVGAYSELFPIAGLILAKTLLALEIQMSHVIHDHGCSRGSMMVGELLR